MVSLLLPSNWLKVVPLFWLLIQPLTVYAAFSVDSRETSHDDRNTAVSVLHSRDVVRPIWSHQIRCIGKTPRDILLPEGLDSIADMTVRQFCAKEIYGGTAFRHYRGIGAYCAG